METEIKDQEPTRTHEQFDASDSDVTIQSSDRVLFRLHLKNLETNTGAFPGAEFFTQGEVIRLEEQATTLEIIFQCIYPKKHPKLENMEFTTLAKVAEAVEKYEVFSAMNICEIRLREFLPEHATDILVHAIKHDYPKLVNEAALCLSRSSSVVQITKYLPMMCIHPWLRYYEAWNAVFDGALSDIKAARRYKDGSGKCYPNDGEVCDICRCSLIALVTDLESLDTLPALKIALSSPCSNPHLRYCDECKKEGCWYTSKVAKICKDGINAIPPFEEYQNGKR